MPDDIKKEYSKAKKAFNQRVKRLKAQGVNLPKMYEPQITANPTQKDVDYLNYLTSKKIRSVAERFDTDYSKTTPRKNVTLSEPSTADIQPTKNTAKKAKTAKKKTPKTQVSITPSSVNVSGDSFGINDIPEAGKIIINRLREMCEKWAPPANWSKLMIEMKENAKNEALRILDGAISSRGEYEVAVTAEDNADILISLLEKILYDSGGKADISQKRYSTNSDLTEFANILFGRNISMAERMAMHGLEEDED